jgi:2-polyprenyl-3-methyl-5-hydroxy-6-metoxy-1,4-benzoquinol methylase
MCIRICSPIHFAIPLSLFRRYGTAFPAIAAAIAPHMSGKTASTVDVGCGHGFLVEAWRDAGYTSSYGVEGSPEAASMWPAKHKEEFYTVQDLTTGDYELPKTDYVTSFEVAEHLAPQHADRFVKVRTLSNQ